MASFEKGDVVHFFRRKKGGKGIALKTIPDLQSQIEYDLKGVFLFFGDSTRNSMVPHYVPHYVHHYLGFQYGVKEEELRMAITYSIYYTGMFRNSYDKKLKRRVLKKPVFNSMTKVYWFETPELYGVPTRQQEELWYPTEWLAKIKK